METVATAVQINQMLISILTTCIGWIGFIIVLLILKNFFSTAITRAAQELIMRSDASTQRLIIKHLADREMLLEELYNELKPRYETDSTTPEGR